jgi:hypothetical protein
MEAASTIEVNQYLPGFHLNPTEAKLLGFYLSHVGLNNGFVMVSYNLP